MIRLECEFFKLVGWELVQVKVGGVVVLFVFLQMVVNWYGDCGMLGFYDYGWFWLQDGNVKGVVVEMLLCDLFGLNGLGVV